MEEYLQEQEAESDSIQVRIEADPQYQTAMAEMRERLMGRWSTRR
jgi:hypothetical protein